jgi:hypothetical protein
MKSNHDILGNLNKIDILIKTITDRDVPSEIIDEISFFYQETKTLARNKLSNREANIKYNELVSCLKSQVLSEIFMQSELCRKILTVL